MNVLLQNNKIESIFKHTLVLVQERGFHGTPMSQIAKMSNVAIGTIYHYFPSKEALILALYQYCKQKIHSYIFDDMDAGLTYRERFAVVFKRFCSFYIDNPHKFSFMEQFYNSPFFESIRCDVGENQYEENRLMTFLLEGIKLKHLQDVEVMVLSATYIGVAVSFSKTILYGKVKYEEHMVNKLIDIIWNGIKTD